MVALTILSGKRRLCVNKEWELDAEEDLDPDESITDDIVLKLIQETSSDFYETALELIRDGNLKLTDPERILDLPIPNDEWTLGGRLESEYSLGVEGIKEKILDVASNSLLENYRLAAIDLMEDFFSEIDPEFIAKIYRNETVFENANKLASLAVDNPHIAFKNIYLEVIHYDLDSNSSSTYSIESSLKALMKVQSIKEVETAVKMLIERDEFSILADSIKELALLDAQIDWYVICRWCIENEKEIGNVLLIAALKSIDVICSFEKYLSQDNMFIFSIAKRCMYYLYRNEEILTEIESIISEQLNQDFNEFDTHQIWGLLYLIDGILEFRDKDTGLSLLEKYYEMANGTFPKRAAWDRLTNLGREIYHEDFSGGELNRPYGWLKIDQPPFGIA